jgi:ElaB/YqjD/DUF883 family membrane-anchored ribosome-binding protein
MREEYQALMEKQLAEWKAQAERFKAGAQQLEAQAKAQFDSNLELLRGKQAEAWDHFQKMKAAHEGSWAQTRAHLEKAGEEIRAAVEQLTKSTKP